MWAALHQFISMTLNDFSANTNSKQARSDEQGFFAKYLHAFVSVFQNVFTVCRY